MGRIDDILDDDEWSFPISIGIALIVISFLVFIITVLKDLGVI